jgi:hypothetical protein
MALCATGGCHRLFLQKHTSRGTGVRLAGVVCRCVCDACCADCGLPSSRIRWSCKDNNHSQMLVNALLFARDLWFALVRCMTAACKPATSDHVNNQTA